MYISRKTDANKSVSEDQKIDNLVDNILRRRRAKQIVQQLDVEAGLGANSVPKRSLWKPIWRVVQWIVLMCWRLVVVAVVVIVALLVGIVRGSKGK